MAENHKASEEKDEIERLTGVSLAKRSELIAQGALSFTAAGIDADGQPMIRPTQANQLSAMVVGLALSADMRDLCANTVREPSSVDRYIDHVMLNISLVVKRRKDDDRKADVAAVMDALAGGTAARGSTLT